MSASDIEKLVPNISKACQFNTGGGGADAVSKRKHCMELTKKNVLSSKAVTSRSRSVQRVSSAMLSGGPVVEFQSLGNSVGN